jgi:SAM-dependent methyltransferase
MSMNYAHRKICSSAKWSRAVADKMPGKLAGLDLGESVLEVGPGFGATTDALLACGVPALTLLEIDDASARFLRDRFGGQATIVSGSGAEMPFEEGMFSSVVSFTMLHHMPTAAAQDALFAEACRVLRPGGLLRGTDSQPSLRFRLLHLGDTMTVIDPHTLPDRLSRAGFQAIKVTHTPKRIVDFSARKPA